MRTYEYRGFSTEGRLERGLVQGWNVKDARQRLAARAVLAEQLRPVAAAGKFRLSERSIFYRELGALVGAGFTLVASLDMLIESPEGGRTRPLLARVRDRVNEGSSLAVALSETSRSISMFEKAVLVSAEKSGSLDSVLNRLADFLEEQERLVERIHNALVYPAVVLGVGLCLAVIMMGVLLPRTEKIFAGGREHLPGLTAFMLGVGSFVSQWWPVLLVLGGLCVWGIRRWLRISEKARGWKARHLFAIPCFGPAYRALVNLRFSRTLAMLLRSGVNAIDAYVLSGRSTGNAWIAGLVEREAEALRQGARLSDAVARIPPLSGALPGWIRSGEMGGGLDDLLESAGARFQSQWERSVSRLLGLLEPVLILFIGLFVLLVTLSILLPILNVTRTVAQ